MKDQCYKVGIRAAVLAPFIVAFHQVWHFLSPPVWCALPLAGGSTAGDVPA